MTRFATAGRKRQIMECLDCMMPDDALELLAHVVGEVITQPETNKERLALCRRFNAEINGWLGRNDDRERKANLAKAG